MTQFAPTVEFATEGQVEFTKNKIRDALSDFYAEALAEAEIPSFDKFKSVEDVAAALEEKGVGLTGLNIDVVPHSRKSVDSKMSTLFDQHGDVQHGSLVTIKLDGADCYENFFADPSRIESF